MVATTVLNRTDLLKFRRWLPFIHNLPGAFKPAREENTTWLPLCEERGKCGAADWQSATHCGPVSRIRPHLLRAFLFTQISS